MSNNQTVRYVCPGCFNTYGSLADLEAHRRNVHDWRKIGEREWLRTPDNYDARSDRRIAELEQLVLSLRAEIEELKERLDQK